MLIQDDEEAFRFDFETYLEELEKAEATVADGLPNSRLPGGGVVGGTTRKDLKRGTVVCRHWLRGLCMKGDVCEFLHQFDLERMPECRWGVECQIPDCPFRHVAEEDRVECMFYKQGFCLHGPMCRYRHIKLPTEECPEVADFSGHGDGTDEHGAKRRKVQPANDFFKIALCKHWQANGECPFGEDCHFAHGEEELRDHPGTSSKAKRADDDSIQLPDLGENPRFFVVKSLNYRNLAFGIEKKRWAVPDSHSNTIKTAYNAGEKVVLFFTVNQSRHFQGCAVMKGPVMEETSLHSAHHAGGDDGDDFTDLPEIDIGDEAPMDAPASYDTQGKKQRRWKNEFEIEVLRLCELPHSDLFGLANALDNNRPVDASRDYQELDSDCGKSMLRFLYGQPTIALHLDTLDDDATREISAADLAKRRLESSLVIRGEKISEPEIPGFARFPVQGPGFVFACNSKTVEEVFQRLLFGLPADHEKNISAIREGMPAFVLNTSTGELFGVFITTSPAVMNMEPHAFTRRANVPTPFPLQIRFAVALPAPPISSTDARIKDKITDRGIRLGPLSEVHAQTLADIFAEEAGIAAPGERQLGSGPGPDGKKYHENFIIGIENDNIFQVGRRVIGQQGANMKRIVTESGGARVRFQGRGAGAGKDTEKDDPNMPLQIAVSADKEEQFKKACKLVIEMLDEIHKDYAEFLAKGGRGRNGARHIPNMPPMGPMPGMFGPGPPHGPPPMFFPGEFPPPGGRRGGGGGGGPGGPAREEAWGKYGSPPPGPPSGGPMNGPGAGGGAQGPQRRGGPRSAGGKK